MIACFTAQVEIQALTLEVSQNEEQLTRLQAHANTLRVLLQREQQVVDEAVARELARRQRDGGAVSDAGGAESDASRGGAATETETEGELDDEPGAARVRGCFNNSDWMPDPEYTMVSVFLSICIFGVVHQAG